MEPYTPVEISISRNQVEYSIDRQHFIGQPDFGEEMLRRLRELRLEGDPEAYGEELCKATFSGQGNAEDGFAILRNEKTRQFRLCLKLSPFDPVLHSLWWECLVDPKDKYLKMSRLVRTPLSRYLFQPGTGETNPIQEEKLRVLVVVSNPVGLGQESSGWGHLPPIDEQKEVDLVEDVLRQFDDRVEYKILTERASLDQISFYLLSGGYHVLHIVGHGGLKNNRGYLLLEKDEDESISPVDDESMANALLNAMNLQIVLLCSCYSAAHSESSAFVGMAQKIVEGGRPAVIAMQDLLNESTAHRFTENFYKAFLQIKQTLGHVDASVNMARHQVYIAGMQDWDWAVPVLYLHGNGLVYQPPSPGVALGRGPSGEAIRKVEMAASRAESYMDEESSYWMKLKSSPVPPKGWGRPGMAGYAQAIQSQIPPGLQGIVQQGVRSFSKQISGQDVLKINKHLGK
jgi:hypothetical protein